MAQYFWQASDYTTGTNPSEWTARNAVDQLVIESDGSGNNYLRVGSVEGSRSTATYDTPGQIEGVEVYCRMTDLGSGDTLSVCMRATGLDGSNEDMCRSDWSPENQDADKAKIAEYASGSFNSLQVYSFTGTASDIVKMRCEMQSGSQDASAKMWLDGNSEPASYEATATTAISGTGYAGINRFGSGAGGDVAVYEFGVGTGGDSAPTVATPEITMSSAVVAVATSVGSVKGSVSGTAVDSGGSALSSGTMYAVAVDRPNPEVHSTTIQADGSFTFTGLLTGETYHIWGEHDTGSEIITPQVRLEDPS